MTKQILQAPQVGEAIHIDEAGRIQVPFTPIIPYIEGDGCGAEISAVMRRVTDAAVLAAYDGQRQIQWLEIFMGEKAAQLYEGDWFPAETLSALKRYHAAIKGPITTPLGSGFRSLNVTLRHELDLYATIRPAQWFQGMPSPMAVPDEIDVIVFRENSEDIYACIEWQSGSTEGREVIEFLQTDMGVGNIRFSDDCAIGVKPISKQGSKRLIRAAIRYALQQNLPSVTLVHKGDVLKHTEGAFMRWGYELAAEEFGAHRNETGEFVIDNDATGKKLVIKDVLADAVLQELLLKPSEYSVIATTNQNGDYLSDFVAAQVGGVDVCAVANVSDQVALFEVSHGTQVDKVGQDSANPTSMILAADMMLRHIGWNSAADKIIAALNIALGKLQSTMMTADISCSELAQHLIAHLQAE